MKAKASECIKCFYVKLVCEARWSYYTSVKLLSNGVLINVQRGAMGMTLEGLLYNPFLQNSLYHKTPKRLVILALELARRRALLLDQAFLYTYKGTSTFSINSLHILFNYINQCVKRGLTRVFQFFVKRRGLYFCYSFLKQFIPPNRQNHSTVIKHVKY